jgi:hypothetical protein
MCYEDREGCDRKFSRPIWSTMWIRTDDRGSCNNIIWHDIWIGTDVKGCCVDQSTVLYGLDSMWQEVSWQMWSNIWIRTDDTGWCLDLIWCALWFEHLWMYDVMT